MGKTGSKSSRRANQKSKPSAKVVKSAKVQTNVSDFEKERQNMLERHHNKSPKNAPQKQTKLSQKSRQSNLSNALTSSQTFGVDRRELSTVLNAATSTLGAPVILQARHKMDYVREGDVEVSNPFSAFASSGSDSSENNLQVTPQNFNWKPPTLSSTPRLINYLGPPGTWSHSAARTYLEKINDPEITLIPHSTIQSCVTSTDSNVTCILPISNTLSGHVIDTSSALLNSGLECVITFDVKITHSLLSKAKNLNDVTIVYSKSQALKQCENMLKERLPNATVKETTSTVAGYDIAKGDYNAGCLCRKDILHEINNNNNMNVLIEVANDVEDNFTTFGVFRSSLTGGT
ncbi:hypothetical protein TrLO_g15317 [Triparma laevis f. longispina]|uniref:Prephenate dehydratase domain-containing protein n=1 Tax=Triparma laevis f. longispina TaxID=1714387 RepID=A0A9W7FRQ1_9STRA|nr:hypothetical protein TrLO_g15317 [Triparma laevis f. longispina]